LVAMGLGLAYASADGGATWTAANAPVKIWTSVASSADGAQFVAVSDGIYISTNAGLNWTSAHAPAAKWTSVASSADGTKLVAAAGGFSAIGGIYTWQSGPPPALAITPSRDGAVISWPASPAGFGLQQNSNLTSTNWADVTTIPVVTNEQNQVIETFSDAARYFRLKHP